MAKTGNDVIAEWIMRGRLTEAQAKENEARYLSFIEQARSGILAECNIPQGASVPDGLFYVWVDIAWSAVNGGENAAAASGAIKSISEGDTTVTFATAAETSASESIARSISDHSAELNRFRRIPW